MFAALQDLIAQHKRPALLFGALVVLMQFSDPLGSSSLQDAATFWSVRLMGVVLSLVFAEWILGRFFRDALKSPRWLKPAVLSILIAAIPMTLVEVGLEIKIPQADAFDDSELRLNSPMLAALTEYLTVVSIVLPINVLIWMLLHPREAEKPDVIASEPTFLDKIAGVDATDVLALEAQGHYVNVITASRSVQVYCRFRDAVSQMPDLLGLQVHRSWWVAVSPQPLESRGGRRHQLKLSNGIYVPVGDTFLPDLRQRGLVATSRRHTEG